METNLGEIQKIFDNQNIEEIMVNGLDGVFVKKRNTDGIIKTDIKFESIEKVLVLCEKLLRNTGRKVNMASPIVDLRLPDGSRANIVLAPVAINGPVITIRKFPKLAITLEDLVKNKTIDIKNCKVLKNAVKNKLNIVIAGATSSGKTTTLSALCQEFDKRERVVVVEETSEINVKDVLFNVINLETRLKSSDQNLEITQRDLIRNALRMRPDRIIVGEVRGGEAFDMLQAINTGHKGSISTLHANSAQDALYRLEAMVLLAGLKGVDISTIRKWIVSAVDLVIFQEKMKDGSRKVTEIVKVKPDFSVQKI